MIPLHREFTAEIKKLKFETDQGIKFPYTALIHFYVGEKEKPVVELMGYMEEKEIYNAIDRGEAINLDNCYVDKFSLRDYRLTRNLDAREKVAIKGFSARNTLFACLSPLDFSFAIFEGEDFSMENSWVSKEDLNFESACFKTQNSSFHNARLPDGYLNFKNVSFESSEITFKNCRMGSGDKDFQYMRIGRGDLVFINTEFSNGNVNFINTDFGKGNVSFKIARFGTGRVDFHFATFKGGAVSFERTEFGEGRVDFRTVEFGTGRVNFNRSVFGNGAVDFDEAEMAGGKFNFKRASFGSGDISFDDVMFENVDVNFEHTDFGAGKLSFYKSWFKTLSMKFCHLNGYVDLRLKKSTSVDLTNTVVRDIIDINPHEFNSDIETISLAGMRLIGRIYLGWTHSEVKRMIYSQKDSSHRIKAEQFRILKENFANQGSYNDEDRAYVEFKRNESKAELSESLEKKPLSGLYHYPLY
jgi:hypothetical protein